MSFAVKVKAPDMGRWEFMTPDGSLCHLRVHAGIVDDRLDAEVFADRLMARNPGVLARVVEFS